MDEIPRNSRIYVLNGAEMELENGKPIGGFFAKNAMFCL